MPYFKKGKSCMAVALTCTSILIIQDLTLCNKDAFPLLFSVREMLHYSIEDMSQEDTEFLSRFVFLSVVGGVVVLQKIFFTLSL